MKVERVLRRLKLPENLVDLIRFNDLFAAIDRAYARLDELNALIDVWEQENPHAAAEAPWAHAREQWKQAGRPRPPWWQALAVFTNQPLKADELIHRVVQEHSRQSNRRAWQDPERREKARQARGPAQRRANKFKGPFAPKRKTGE